MSTCFELTDQNLDLDSPDRSDLSFGNRDRGNTTCIFLNSEVTLGTESEGLPERTKNGYKGRAAYRFLNRKRKCETTPTSDLAAKRLNSDAIQTCFVKNGVDVVSCCIHFAADNSLARWESKRSIRSARRNSSPGAASSKQLGPQRRRYTKMGKSTTKKDFSFE